MYLSSFNSTSGSLLVIHSNSGCVYRRSIRKKRSIRVESGRHFNGSMAPLFKDENVYISSIYSTSARFSVMNSNSGCVNRCSVRKQRSIRAEGSQHTATARWCRFLRTRRCGCRLSMRLQPLFMERRFLNNLFIRV